MVIFWLALGVVLLLAELRHFGFFSLFGSLGSFAAAGVAAVAPDAIPVQVAVAVVVAVIGIIAVRPLMSRAFHHRYQEGRLGRGVYGTLVGEEVLTLDDVGDANHPGHVRLAGERWLAASGGGGTIPSGTPVIVTGVQSTTLIVWPVDGRVDIELPNSTEESADRSEGEQS